MTVRRARGLAPQIKPEATIAGFAGRFHLHSCTSCGHTYGCSCTSPAVNGRCGDCRTDHGRPLWDRDRDPAPCCGRDQLDLLTRADDLKTYQLAGPGPWWKCRTCARVHGRDIVKGLKA